MARKANPAIALTVERDALQSGLSEIVKAVEKRNVIPILSNFLLEAGDGVLIVTGTNLDVAATATIPAEVTQPGAVTVTAESLAKFADKAPAGAQIAMSGDAETERVTVTAARSKFQLPTRPAGDFPIFADRANEGTTFPHRITIAGSVLAEALKRGKFAISNEETRYFLNGTYCHVVATDDGAALRLVSTTGAELAQLTTTHARGLDEAMPGVIIPKLTVSLFERLGAVAGDAEVTLDIGASLIRARAGTLSICSKLIDGDFPDYARVIPRSFIREAVAPTLALIAASDRVATLAEGKKSRGVKLAFTADSLTITARNLSDGGEAQDELDIELTGDPLDIGFDARRLANVLAQAGGDTVRLCLGDAGSPLVVTDKAGDGLFVLMPMRI